MIAITLQTMISATALGTLTACSMEQMIVCSVGDVLGKESEQLFKTEEDPKIAADALPMLIKLSEAQIQEDPANPNLRLNAGRLFITYADVFVLGPVELLPDADFEHRTEEMRRATHFLEDINELFLSAGSV